MDTTLTMIGAFLGFGMWLFASVLYQFRMPLWYLLLLMAVMIFTANFKTLFDV